ncbi:uncharacterized protein BO80DRAFT_416498 [Aspergillus ibericus CBS 121593]|uniref:DUF7704 domain-containing protein n=1 Tax=Aspergillus ibericus CBS 121593 TaxID=1448316 RepID=A0A395GM21_9EURO|nr:hypothetical protein BO80DRAFT_416498 [Aspergillus ibericus CBS 121593]RAK96545.1 hypothetical protein BO80DRAFT_416498 [Aspergillus ibericus CBS 121593]
MPFHLPRSILPPIPYLIFGILEPISLLSGTIYPHLSPTSFIISQIPTNPDPTSTITPSSLSLAYQLSNIYFLLAILGICLLHTTSEPRVIKYYLGCLAVADVTHILAVGWGMGKQRFVDWGGWNALTWGNVGVTGGLFVFRVLVLGGGLGGVSGGRGKKKGKGKGKGKGKKRV